MQIAKVTLTKECEHYADHPEVMTWLRKVERVLNDHLNRFGFSGTHALNERDKTNANTNSN